MNKNVFTHVVTVPHLTDVPQFLGAYKNLLNTLGISNEIPFEASQGFTHPIEESQNKLTQDFMQSMIILKHKSEASGPVICDDVRIGNTTITFVFSHPS